MVGRLALTVLLAIFFVATGVMAQEVSVSAPTLPQTPAPKAVAAPTRPAVPTPRRPQQHRHPRQNSNTPAAPSPPGEPAPMPNRAVEAPRQADAKPTARLSPTLIDPEPTRPHGQRSGFGIQEQEDRLLRQPAPGARLSVPFSY